MQEARARHILAERHFEDAYGCMLRQMRHDCHYGRRCAVVLGPDPPPRLGRLVQGLSRECSSHLQVLWERVLVSQFAGWQAVLNGSPSRARPAGESDANYVARLERIFDDFEVRQKAAGAPRQPVGGSPVDLRADLERTWEHILDPRNFQPFWRLADHHARPPAPEDGRTTKPVTAHRGDVGAR